MKKLLLAFIMGLFFISLVSANLGTFKQGDCVIIKTILNSTTVNISTISSPSSDILLSNVEMTRIGQSFNYTFCNTSELGTYTYDYYDNNGNVYVNDFEITITGESLTIQKTIMFFLFLISSIFLFLLVTYWAIKIPFKNSRNEDNELIGVNDLKYVKIILICFDYIILLFIFGLLRGIMDYYERDVLVGNLFNWAYWVLLSFIWPLIVLSLLFALIMFINDKKLKKALVRGVPTR